MILLGYWMAFAFYPLPGSGLDPRSVGMSPDWPHQLHGFAAHWNKNTNPASAFDRWFLNLFPRESPFEYERGGYSTLNFVPTLATMILGLIAGEVLRSPRTSRGKVAWLSVAGGVSLAVGWGLGSAGICPVVKRIWTPSWVLYSGGWSFLMLAGLFAVIDGLGLRKWSFPLVIIGMNSIAAYVMSWLFKQFIGDALTRHLGEETFLLLGDVYQPLLLGGAVLLVLWLILFWMHQRELFLKI